MSLVRKLLDHAHTSLADRPLDSAGFRPRFETLELRDCPALAAPVVVEFAALTPTTAHVSWEDVANETGYRVLHWDGTKAVPIATLDADATGFDLEELTPNRKEWIAVEAVYSPTKAAQSGWRAATMPAEPITQPTDLLAGAVTADSVTLTWGDSTGETGYRVYAWENSARKLIGTLAADETTFTASNLAPGAYHQFTVEAFNGSNSVYSDWKTVRTGAPPVAAPTGFTATATAPTTVKLAWDEAANATGYKVYYWDGGQAHVIATLGAGARGHTLKGAAEGKTFWFHVQAVNGTSQASTGWKSVATPVSAPLAAPTWVTSKKVAATSVEVGWVKANRAAGYNVYYWDAGKWKLAAKVSATTAKHTVTGLKAGKGYFFLVQSFTEGLTESKNSATSYATL